MGSASSAAARRRTTRSPRKEKGRRVSKSSQAPLAVTLAKRRTPASDVPLAAAKATLAPATTVVVPSARAAELSIAEARAGDHVQLPLLWTAAAAGPSSAEYQATIDDPDYLPSQRILAKRGNAVVGHVQLDIAPLSVQASLLKRGQLRHLVVLPEFRGAGVEGRLLQAAEERTRASESPLIVARHSAPEHFVARSWAPLAATSASVAKARDLLAALVSSRCPGANTVSGASAPTYQVRWYRQVELDGLIRLHNLAAARPAGGVQRDPSAWRRLIQRRAYDHIYVALEGKDCRVDSLQASDHLAGYAVVHRHRIVELVADPRHPDAGRQLLARACGDAVEQGWHEVRLDAPAGDPLHQLFVEAGGAGLAGARDGNAWCLAKVIDFPALISAWGSVLAARLQAARVPQPCRLGVEIGGTSFALEVGRNDASLLPGKSPRVWLAASDSILTRLLLGQLSIEGAIERKELRVSGPLVRKLLAALFPPQSWWLPPWEDLEA